MEIPFTTENVLFVTTVLGVVFSVYLYFRNPQIKMDKQQAIDREEAENQAKSLAQRVQWTVEGNEKRFSEIQNSVKDAFSMAQNHIHTLDIKFDKLTEQVNSMNLGLTRLTTTLEERLPKK
ncbi:hypothetical protein M0R04_13780 [Candidatus Dojkabacteria bacterium]|jgi:hypothetical protein|nr:hypothetical protein [Candidatus Dojkabacteria bacterium]